MNTVNVEKYQPPISIHCAYGRICDSTISRTDFVPNNLVEKSLFAIYVVSGTLPRKK